MNKIKIQRKKHLFKKNVKIYGFQLLGDGRIAMSLGDLGIAIIDPNLQYFQLFRSQKHKSHSGYSSLPHVPHPFH